jgi:hypothetical protein
MDTNATGPDNHLNPNDNRDGKEGHSRLQRLYWLVIILISVIELALNIYAMFFRR